MRGPECDPVARFMTLVLLAGCFLLLVGAASAGTPTDPAGEQIQRISTGGDSFGALLTGSAAEGGTTASGPPWVGLLVMALGGVLGILWLASVLLSILNGPRAFADRTDAEELPPSPYREQKGGAGHEPRADRKRRPSPRSSDWL